MNRFARLTQHELFSAIKNLKVGEHIDFCASFNEDDIQEENEHSTWFGATCIHVLDVDAIVIGEYGGGYITAFELADYLLSDLEHYFADNNDVFWGDVVVDIEGAA